MAVYNVEPYIGRCLHTLFGQTLADIEYIFVDDGSTDGSVSVIYDILDRYPHRKSAVKVLHHGKNCGVAAARTTGIRAATGEYIIHCDPDDWVETDMYEKLYARAVETGADIVACDYLLNDNIMTCDYADTPQACLEDVARNRYRCIHLWTKLVRRSLIVGHDIVPFEGIDYAEDLNCMIRTFYWGESISVVHEPLYHYCTHADSVSTSESYLRNFKAHTENVERICRFLADTGERRYDTLCNYLKFRLKFEFREFFADDREWFYRYRECHKAVMKFKENSLKSRIVLRLALSNYHVYKIAQKFIGNF